jgi:hypothetical protein
MTEPVEPKPEFHSLAEDAVVAALQDPDPANPIAVEVARLIGGYTNNFQAQVQRLGRIPPNILRIKPRWPIEAVAMPPTTKANPRTLVRRRCHPSPPLSILTQFVGFLCSAPNISRQAAVVRSPSAGSKDPSSRHPAMNSGNSFFKIRLTMHLAKGNQ